MKRGGTSLVEVLVATALFAVLATASSSVWLSALRMTTLAEAAAVRARALEPFTLPLAVVAQPPPSCDGDAADADDGAEPSPCLRATVRCHTSENELICSGSGSLARIDLRIPPLGGGPSGGTGDADGADEGQQVRLWAQVPP